jgi:hypothetical protein
MRNRENIPSSQDFTKCVNTTIIVTLNNNIINATLKVGDRTLRAVPADDNVSMLLTSLLLRRSITMTISFELMQGGGEHTE